MMIKDKANALKYMDKLLKDYPKLKNGRKNYKDHERRILDTIKLTKKFIKKIPK